MKKTLIWILGIFLLTTFVSASDGCFVNENCTWWATMTNGDFIDSSANITIINPSGVVIVDNVAMTEISVGKFIYKFQHNITGNYLGYAYFYNDTGVIDVADQSMQIKIPEIGVSTGGVDLSGMMLIVSLLGFSILLLYIVTRLDVKDFGILKLILIICAVMLLIMVPKAAMDYKDHCALTPTNLSMSQTGSLEYNYDYVCVENVKSTTTTFYVVVIRFVWILSMYAFIYGIIILYQYIKLKSKWTQ